MTESIAGASVLVVDDGAVNRRILRGILEKAGAVVSEAAGGEEALRLVRSSPPDLVLLDVVMPGMDGLEVCGALKADPATSDVPVIVVSALGESSDRVRGLSAGAEDYVTKPLRRRRGPGARRDAPPDPEAHPVSPQPEPGADRSAGEDRGGPPGRGGDPEDAPAAGRAPRPPVSPSSGSSSPARRSEATSSTSIPLGAGRTAVYVVDVSGHGVPAALVTVSVSQSLSPMGGVVLDSLGEPTPPAEVLARLDDEYPFERFDRFFTISYLTFDAATGILRYSSAGHPPPLLLRPGERPRPLEEGGTIVGLGTGVAFDEGSVHLEPGDRLALCTDGVLEMFSPSGELFGAERLDDALGAGGALSLAAQRDLVGRRVSDWAAGVPPHDDVSLLLVEVLP